MAARSERIESVWIHYRNDSYSIFNCKDEFPRMDAIEGKYLSLPMHTKVSTADVDRICGVLKSGW